jgi:hypothetical protein
MKVAFLAWLFMAASVAAADLPKPMKILPQSRPQHRHIISVKVYCSLPAVRVNSFSQRFGLWDGFAQVSFPDRRRPLR